MTSALAVSLEKESPVLFFTLCISFSAFSINKERSVSYSKNPKPKRSRFVKLLTIFAVAALVVYSGVTIISQQAQIAQLRKESDAINKKITAAKQLNDEYTRLLSSDDEAEYMEKIAIEKLGYAYPNERRFYIVNNSD
jgi:cell division protein FtsL